MQNKKKKKKEEEEVEEEQQQKKKKKKNACYFFSLRGRCWCFNLSNGETGRLLKTLNHTDVGSDKHFDNQVSASRCCSMTNR